MKTRTFRNSVLTSFGLASALLGCGGEKTSSTAPPSAVEASYQNLAGSFASCAEQADSCVGKAGSDKLALWSCRTDYTKCRAEAGKQALVALVQAIHECVDSARECRMNGTPGDAHKCLEQLRTCLGEARSVNDDDADGGTDEYSGSGSHHECIDGLRQAVTAGKDPETCAKGVRQCIDDSFPSPEEAIPEGGDDQGTGTGIYAPGHGHVGDADAGSDEDGPRDGHLCLSEFRICLKQARGTGARGCVEALWQCAHGKQR
jgi:hypothetical protein